MKKVIILSFSLLAAGLFAGYLFLFSSAQVMGASVLSEEEVSSLLADKVCFSPETDAGLWLNGVEIPYETEEKRYYIPRNMEEDHWKGQICASADGMPASVIWEADEAFDNIKDAVAAGHVFACIIYNETGYQKVSVLFTGIPVMCIDGDMGETDSRVRVFDPVKSLQGNYQTEESRIYYNIRGNASKRFEKIGYRLELLQEDGEEDRKTSLLGMRIDNDWQLKAMYSDRSKLRDKLSIDLWNQIAERTETKADAGCRMEYLELIVNGSYQGLYGLVEPTDYKSLSLNKEKDLIYKAASDEWPDERLFDESEQLQSFSCAGVNIRQAGKKYAPGLWEPFRRFWNSGYEMESQEDLEKLYDCIDRQNFIAYDLYYNAIAGMDNRFKNIIYSTVVHADGTFTIRRIPWDQNYSWGDDFEEGEEKDIKNIRYNPELACRWLNEEVFRNMQKYDSGLSEDMRTTWEEWRGTFLKEEYWKTHARELMEYLTGSGAFARDTVRWPDSNNVAGTGEIEAFIDARFVWLDEYLSRL